MAETTSRSPARAQQYVPIVGRLVVWSLVAALGLLVVAHLLFFAVHATQLLAYPYPLDYGEGPLLAQVGLLRQGLPLWRLYSDPGAPPYAVVNYPPVYHLVSALVSAIVGDALLAGRLVSLAATFGAVAALWALSDGGRTTKDEQPRALSVRPSSSVLRLSIW